MYDAKDTIFEFLFKLDDEITDIDIAIARDMVCWPILVHPDVYARLKVVAAFRVH